MSSTPKTKAHKITNYIDIALQTLLIVFVIILLVNPPQVEIGKELNSPKISSFSDLIKEIMARGTLNLFSVMMSFTLSIILMIIPLLLMWTYQIFTAIVLSLVFKNTFNLIYGLVLLGITIVIANIEVDNTTFERSAPIVLFVFFAFPFLFYGKRIYDTFFSN